MTTEELQERVIRIRKAVANLKQSLTYIEVECDRLQQGLLERDQMELFGDSD